MGVPFGLVRWRRKESDSWTNIYDVVALSSKQSIQAKNNTFNIQVANPYDKYRDGEGLYFAQGEFIQLWLDETIPISTGSSSQLVLSGVIQGSKQMVTSAGRIITIDALDRSYHLLHGIFSKNYSGTQFNTAPLIIKNVIQHLTDQGNRSYNITTSNVATTTSTGGSFKEIDFTALNKSGYEIIKTLSQTSNTGDDRGYIFWVDKDNDFHWVYPSQTSSNTITEGQQNMISMTIRQETWDVVNFIIFNSGTDMNGVGVLWYFYDENSDQPDLRMKYEPMTDIAKDLNEKERLHMADIDAAQGADGYPDSYPYTCSWNAVSDTNGVLTESTSKETASDDSDYNDKFRLKCRYDGLTKARHITQLHGKARTKATIALKR